MKQDFYNWLVTKKGLKENVAKTNVSRLQRINELYNVFNEYFRDNCEYLLSLFEYSKQDERDGALPSHDIFIVGNYYTGTQSLKYALKLYIEYMNDDEYLDIILNGKSNGVSEDEMFNITDDEWKELVAALGEMEREEKGIQEQQEDLQSEEEESFIEKTKPIVFMGNLQSFLRYIGPFCKNYVNSIAKVERTRHNGICEYCGKKAVLDSAHRDGEDRPIIIKNILEANYKKSEDYYEINIVEFEKKFKEAHLPVENHIFFLCKECHTEYDRGTKIKTEDILKKRK